ncbi:hypothetical protein [Streptomyces boluensis]|uniref:Gram-positive cocci surface proteins LPxTG domain-containing protein n=1 Tax=Streptomyces boluensis TaxID=1775135 RepID=A0A964XK66_9ACTN|nr:hypothetical protein [Streptomyces boluensis]NBE52059.1 hypothetical protein [Streptomyces boluensis]
MRLRSAFALGATAVALAAVSVVAPAAAQERAAVSSRVAVARPTCDEGTGDFPVESRLHGGPDSYRPGAEPQAWSLDLVNTSDVTCGTIHPVVVLLDRDRELRPEQLKLDFQDPDGHWHPVRFERTDRDENVGVFEDGFTGFSIAPGSSVTVPVRLAVTSDARDNEVTATVAVVQRRDDDGDWVGQSGDHTFTIRAGSEPGERREHRSTAAELAETGPKRDDALLGLGAATGVLLLGGAALVAGARRLRRARR